MTINEYYLKEDLYPIFIFHDLIASELFFLFENYFGKRTKKFLSGLRDKSI